jgi:hypothetical protein
MQLKEEFMLPSGVRASAAAATKLPRKLLEVFLEVRDCL